MTVNYQQQQPALEPFYPKIVEWAEARNLIKGATPQAQFVKLIEEFQEFISGLHAHDIEEIEDGLGDTVVVLNVLAAQLGTSVPECLEYTDTQNDSLLFYRFEDEESMSAYIRMMFVAFGTLGTGISKKNMPMVKKGISAAMMMLVFMAYECDLTLSGCTEHSYNEIKDRKGKMIDGVFVKEADFGIYGVN